MDDAMTYPGYFAAIAAAWRGPDLIEFRWLFTNTDDAREGWSWVR